MSDKKRIRVQDFYKDAVGNQEYIEVSEEVYETLVNTFRKEAHAQEMKDFRHVTKDGYTEGDTEDLVLFQEESLEDYVIRQIEIENLQKEIQSLTAIQKQRLQLYFFDGFTYRKIGEKLGVDEKAVRNSITAALKKIKKILS